MMIIGCKECDCYSRLGNSWTQERIVGVRDPYLRKRVDRARLHMFWGARIDGEKLAAETELFRTELARLGKTGNAA